MRYLKNQPLKQFILNSIKEIMFYSKNKKSFIKFIRKNKRWNYKRISKNTPLTFSIEFQKREKGVLMIPCRYKNNHVQILVDKNFQLVKFTKSKIPYKISDY